MATEVNYSKPDHYFRTEIPNIVFDLGIHPQALALYGYYKRVAGDESGCWRSNATITKQLGMSANTIIKYRKELCKPHQLLGGKSLIKSTNRKTEKGSPDTVLVQIVDIWRDNGDFYRNKESSKGTSKSEGGVPQKVREGTSKSAHKEEPFKKNPLKKNIAQSAKAASQGADFSYSRESGKFEGISPEDLADWKIAYPDTDISKEIIKATQWLKSNPNKANKRLWRKFLVGWFTRCNDKAENKKAYRSQSGQSEDRRTKNVDGTAVNSPADGLF